jgi:hydrogenase maturation protein HypF
MTMRSPGQHKAVKPTPDDAVQRLSLKVSGRVQGVGFRPFVYRLAQRHGLTGSVRNCSSGVIIDIQGGREQLDGFQRLLRAEQPPQADIQSVVAEVLPPDGFREFSIVPSTADQSARPVITPDLAICDDCRREVLDPANRRYRYPFTNCTNCGPRYSIIEGLPYDRGRTTMRGFVMCPECEAEYRDPLNRRFHAQPNACPVCGPQVRLLDATRRAIGERDEALSGAAQALREGRVVALKGLGGYQLLVDARDERAVQRLRERKARAEKPLAVMYPTLEMVRRHCRVLPVAEQWLISSVAPIVLLPVKTEDVDMTDQPCECVCCGVGMLGVMLPYTPLHLLLLNDLGFPVVATSGNRSGDPICVDDEAALHELGDIADVFLMHNRPIGRPVDDSVVRVVGDRAVVFRLARGLAPCVVPSPMAEKPLLAAGGHTKNAFVLADRGSIVLSQHMGDLDSPLSRRNFRISVDDLARLYGCAPTAVACDMHPDYFTTGYAAAEGVAVPVQHHLAHVIAVMAEHSLEGPVTGMSWDGTGFGEDGSIWGGEAFVVEGTSCRRVASLRQFLLPGGERAVRDPRRSGFGLLYAHYGIDYLDMLPPSLRGAMYAEEMVLLHSMLKREVNCPHTSSVGRLFDAVAALLGVFSRESTFEGQAAMMLEAAADRSSDSRIMPFRLVETGEQSPVRVDWGPMLDCLLTECDPEGRVADLARRFHSTLAQVAVEIVRRAGIRAVVLSGGCFQNALLLSMCEQRLRHEGYSVYVAERVPANDGGLAVGQAMAAAIGLRREE